MSDITKCADRHCPSRKDCWRYVAPSDQVSQSLADFDRQDGDRCEAFEPASEHRKKDVAPH